MSPSFRASLLFRYAQFLSTFGLKRQAHAFLGLALQQNGDHQRAWAFSGFLHAEQGRWEAAIRDFAKALALKPGDADTAFNLAYALQQLGRHADALARLQEVVALNPFIDRAWYGMGLSLAKLERHAEAAEKFTEAARLQPMNPHAGYHLAAAWFHLGQRDKLEAEYVRVLGFDPKVAAQIAHEFGVGQQPKT